MTGLLHVEGLGLATRAGRVFSDVSFTLEPRTLAVVLGPAGSGRSALLLAVCGRMRGTTGSVRLGDRSLSTRPADLRRATSVARLGTVVQLEEQLSVAESTTERALVDGVQRADAEAALAAAEEAFGVTFPRDRLVQDLGAYEQTLLAVALATARPAELVVLDDADRSLDVADQQRLYAALARLCATGPSILAASAEAAAVPAGTPVVPLPTPAPAPAPAEPTSAPAPAEPTPDPVPGERPSAPAPAAPTTDPVPAPAPDPTAGETD